MNVLSIGYGTRYVVTWIGAHQNEAADWRALEEEATVLISTVVLYHGSMDTLQHLLVK